MPKIKSVGINGRPANSYAIQYTPGTTLKAAGRKARVIEVGPDIAVQVYADERDYILSQFDGIVEIKE